LGKKVTTIGNPDVSALGAALLAGLKTGVFDSLEVITELPVAQKSFFPDADANQIKQSYAVWQQLI